MILGVQLLLLVLAHGTTDYVKGRQELSSHIFTVVLVVLQKWLTE
jgi:hypothetical protein